uniref:Uncharacterized protein n=1 Tax=Micrurus lemniscatus lemniscatus TaxID=129467 RepID=A0A2D4I5D6_MICLE
MTEKVVNKKQNIHHSSFLPYILADYSGEECNLSRDFTALNPNLTVSIYFSFHLALTLCAMFPVRKKHDYCTVYSQCKASHKQATESVIFYIRFTTLQNKLPNQP